ncbi:MAG: hypothetical protein N4A54_03900 [Peptostreptococcaceae bacterium]|jgi:hypothetical protein|nr:hypothetical protein [Peptostreptococcaceae bacterium]
MKFSYSLLKNTDIRQKLYSNGVAKTKELLKDVFGLDFEKEDPKIIDIKVQEKEFCFGVIFLLNGRKISAGYGLEKEKDNIVSEILLITETEEEKVIIKNISNKFEDNINKVQEYLEERYELNFTPLDPNEKDENIIEIINNKADLTWEVTFIQEHHESKFIARFMQIENTTYNMQITQLKKHKIYLD